jgi:hypothetical protein
MEIVDDTMIIKNVYSSYGLNYNFTGETGALLLAALITHEFIADGVLYSTSSTFSPDVNSRKEPI